MKWYWWLAIAAILVLSTLYTMEVNRRSSAMKTLTDNAMKGKKFTEADAVPALAKVKAVYGKDMAVLIEKVARWETAHFKSKQYQLTGTGGMEAFGSAPYYGWFAPFFVANPSYAPIGTTAMLENKGLSAEGGNAQSAKPKVFVIMPSVEAWMMFLADYSTRYKSSGGIARWYSTDPANQKLYMDKLATVSPKIVNSLA
jgi:hypothetical protein